MGIFSFFRSNIFADLVTSEKTQIFVEGNVGAISSFNPLYITQNVVDSDIQALVFEKFIEISKDGQPKEKIAKDWVVSGDGKTYDFTINLDHKWQDGVPLTIDDVIFTFEIAKERGYRKAMLLPVSAPFHCALMKPAADRLAEVLAGVVLAKMAVPVVTNVKAVPNSDEGRVRELLVSQVCEPVLWEQSVQAMVQLGVTRFLEIGPGKVLSGLVKRIDKAAAIANFEDTAGLAHLS